MVTEREKHSGLKIAILDKKIKPMLRKSIYGLRYSAVLLLISVLVYLFDPSIGKYLLGISFIFISISTVLYIVFMFTRYGEKKSNS